MNSSSNFVKHTSSYELVVSCDTLKIKATCCLFKREAYICMLVLDELELILFIDCVVTCCNKAARTQFLHAGKANFLFR